MNSLSRKRTNWAAIGVYSRADLILAISAHTSLMIWSCVSLGGGKEHIAAPSETYRWYLGYAVASAALISSHIASALSETNAGSNEARMQFNTRVLLQLAMYSLIISFSMSCVGLRSAITCVSHSSAGMKVWKYSIRVPPVPDAATRAAIFFWKVSFANCCLYTVKVSHSGSCTSCWVMCGATCIALCTRYERAYVAASGSPKPRTICTILRSTVGSSDAGISMR